MRPVPLGGSFINVAMAGKIDASVLPPAVGASTTAFFPSRIAAPASSCTGRRLVHPRRDTMASCRRGGKRAKVLTSGPRFLEAHRRVALVIVRLSVVGRLALHFSDLVLGGILGGKPYLGRWIEVIVLAHRVHHVDESTQKLPRHHAHEIGRAHV